MTSFSTYNFVDVPPSQQTSIFKTPKLSLLRDPTPSYSFLDNGFCFLNGFRVGLDTNRSTGAASFESVRIDVIVAVSSPFQLMKLYVF